MSSAVESTESAQGQKTEQKTEHVQGQSRNIMETQKPSLEFDNATIAWGRNVLLYLATDSLFVLYHDAESLNRKDSSRRGGSHRNSSSGSKTTAKTTSNVTSVAVVPVDDEGKKTDDLKLTSEKSEYNKMTSQKSEFIDKAVSLQSESPSAMLFAEYFPRLYADTFGGSFLANYPRFALGLALVSIAFVTILSDLVVLAAIREEKFDLRYEGYEPYHYEAEHDDLASLLERKENGGEGVFYCRPSQVFLDTALKRFPASIHDAKPFTEKEQTELGRRSFFEELFWKNGKNSKNSRLGKVSYSDVATPILPEEYAFVLLGCSMKVGGWGCNLFAFFSSWLADCCIVFVVVYILHLILQVYERKTNERASRSLALGRESDQLREDWGESMIIYEPRKVIKWCFCVTTIALLIPRVFISSLPAIVSICLYAAPIRPVMVAVLLLWRKRLASDMFYEDGRKIRFLRFIHFFYNYFVHFAVGGIGYAFARDDPHPELSDVTAGSVGNSLGTPAVILMILFLREENRTDNGKVVPLTDEVRRSIRVSSISAKSILGVKNLKPVALIFGLFFLACSPGILTTGAAMGFPVQALQLLYWQGFCVFVLTIISRFIDCGLRESEPVFQSFVVFPIMLTGNVYAGIMVFRARIDTADYWLALLVTICFESFRDTKLYFWTDWIANSCSSCCNRKSQTGSEDSEENNNLKNNVKGPLPTNVLTCYQVCSWNIMSGITESYAGLVVGVFVLTEFLTGKIFGGNYAGTAVILVHEMNNDGTPTWDRYPEANYDANIENFPNPDAPPYYDFMLPYGTRSSGSESGDNSNDTPNVRLSDAEFFIRFFGLCLFGTIEHIQTYFCREWNLRKLSETLAESEAFDHMFEEVFAQEAPKHVTRTSILRGTRPADASTQPTKQASSGILGGEPSSSGKGHTIAPSNPLGERHTVAPDIEDSIITEIALTKEQKLAFTQKVVAELYLAWKFGHFGLRIALGAMGIWTTATLLPYCSRVFYV